MRNDKPRREKILMLAQSNYEVQFAPDTRLSERVLFPTTPSQSNGIEDARFVLFHSTRTARRPITPRIPRTMAS
jgi:hypothetical protein